jgi:sec-independent protein translocase protein TatB
MFDVGFWELVVLFGIGLMVLGPERLPKVAAKVGRWVGQARSMASHLTNQIRDEIEPVNTVMKTDFSAHRPEPGQPDTSTKSAKSDSSDSADKS